MTPTDLFRLSTTNLDYLTETYNISFYLEYLTKWPHLCRVIEGRDGEIEGYSTSLTSSSVKISRRIPTKHDADTYLARSPRQAGVVALPAPRGALRPGHEPEPELSALARAHHRPHRRSRGAQARARDAPEPRARRGLRQGGRLVCGLVRAQGESRGAGAVQGDGVSFSLSLN